MHYTVEVCHSYYSYRNSFQLHHNLTALAKLKVKLKCQVNIVNFRNVVLCMGFALYTALVLAMKPVESERRRKLLTNSNQSQLYELCTVRSF